MKSGHLDASLSEGGEGAPFSFTHKKTGITVQIDPAGSLSETEREQIRSFGSAAALFLAEVRAMDPTDRRNTIELLSKLLELPVHIAASFRTKGEFELLAKADDPTESGKVWRPYSGAGRISAN